MELLLKKKKNLEKCFHVGIIDNIILLYFSRQRCFNICSHITKRPLLSGGFLISKVYSNSRSARPEQVVGKVLVLDFSYSFGIQLHRQEFPFYHKSLLSARHCDKILFAFSHLFFTIALLIKHYYSSCIEVQMKKLRVK